MNVCDYLDKEKLAIFLFHGVVDQSEYRVRNYTRKHLTRDVFYRHMKALKEQGTPLSMNDVVDHILTRRPFPPRAFAVTFDDGFENNYSVARPVLKELNIPAAIYITTGFIENNAMSWIDRVEYCFENTKALRVKLPWADESVAMESFQDRRNVLDNIRFHVKRDAGMDVDRFVSGIFEQCAVKEILASSDPLDQKMTWEQVAQLNRDPDFVIGGHTHTHRIMSYLSPEELAKEVDTSLTLLQSKAAVCVRHYSYPEGLAHCYSQDVIDCLKDRGVVCSPSAEDGLNSCSEDLFHLKRVFVMS